jgi:hypothetical protein
VAVRRTFEDICNETHQRMRRDTAFIQRMILVNAYYNGDIVIPLKVPGEPDMKAPMPNLVAQAIDNQAMRANSIPFLTYVPHLQNTEASKRRAEAKRRGIKAIRHYSGGARLTARWYRHYNGYGTFAGAVRCVKDDYHARMEVRDVLRAYPEHRTPEDIREVLNCAFVTSRSLAWIKKNFGHVQGVHSMLDYQGAEPTDLWDIVEWYDEHDTVIGILGKRWLGPNESMRSPEFAPSRILELSREDTRANGMVPVSVPLRVTLDRVAGVVGNLLGTVDWIAHLQALEVIAAKRGIAPDIAILGDTQDTEPVLVNGDWFPGSTGRANLIQGARGVQLMHANPQEYTARTIGRLQDGVNQDTGNIGLYRGVTGGEGRTGRALDTLMSAASDPRLKESQDMMAAHLSVLETAACEIEKAEWPKRKYICLTGSPGRAALAEYTPGEDFETAPHLTYCPTAGYDVTTLGTILPARKAAGLLSTRTAMELDPFIDDPEAELDQIRYENLEGLVYGLIQQGVVQGSTPIMDVATFAEEIMNGRSPWKAMAKMQAEAQKRQATEAEPGAPETMPGISPPGIGAEQPTPPAPPPGMGTDQRMAMAQQMLQAVRSQPTGGRGGAPQPAGRG